MNCTEFVKNFWKEMDEQNWKELSGYFSPDASICWPNTKEHFTVSEFVHVNEVYPGRWNITVNRLEETGNTVISVVSVRLADGETEFTAISFFEFVDDYISVLTEYWGDISEPPEWRKKKDQ